MINVVRGFENKPNDFYVYLHRRLDTMEVFYVGKGKGDRAWKITGKSKTRNKHWENVANKYGVYIEIVKDGLQEWYALELEKELICRYGRSDLKQGYLVNKTDGGESGTGVIFSKEYMLNHRKSRLLMGKRVVINNNVCMLTIKDAARYLLPCGYSVKEFKTACSAISNCVNKVTKSFHNNIIHFVDENYEDVVEWSKIHYKVDVSDIEIIKQHDDYIKSIKTIVEIAKELKLTEGYLQAVFKGVYRKHLNLAIKPLEDRNKFNNDAVIADLSGMTAIAVMEKYSISKTHLYRLKRKYLNETLDSQI